MRALSNEEVGFLTTAGKRFPVMFGCAELSEHVRPFDGAVLVFELEPTSVPGDGPAAVALRLSKILKPDLKPGFALPAEPGEKRLVLLVRRVALNGGDVRGWLAELLVSGLLVAAAIPSSGVGVRLEGAAVGDLLAGSRVVPLDNGQPIASLWPLMRLDIRTTADGAESFGPAAAPKDLKRVAGSASSPSS